MYILSFINQIKNAFLRIWASKNWKRVIIYSLVFASIFYYATRTLNSMIRRDQIDLPAQVESVIGVMYAETNKLYAERMKARQQQQQQQQPAQGAQQQQQERSGGEQQDRGNQGQVRASQGQERQQGQQGQQQNVSQQQPQQQQQQQVTNRGGRKTSYMPINALVIIVQLIAMSAICCLIIFLVYKRFTKDSVPPLPVLYTKGKLNEEQ